MRTIAENMPLRRRASFALLGLFLFLVCCAGPSRNGNSGSNTALSNTATEGTPPAAASPEPSKDQKARHEPSLVALSAGAFIVKRPSEWAGYESAYNLLDDRASIWATDKGVT